MSNMSENKKPTRTSGADPSPERIVEDGRSGLDRLREFTKAILKAPKHPTGGITGSSANRRGV